MTDSRGGGIGRHKQWFYRTMLRTSCGVQIPVLGVNRGVLMRAIGFVALVIAFASNAIALMGICKLIRDNGLTLSTVVLAIATLTNICVVSGEIEEIVRYGII